MCLGSLASVLVGASSRPFDISLLFTTCSSKSSMYAYILATFTGEVLQFPVALLNLSLYLKHRLIMRFICCRSINGKECCEQYPVPVLTMENVIIMLVWDNIDGPKGL